MKLVQKALEREVNVLSRIRYPNIVLFVAHSFDNNAFHIVSEYTQCSNVDDLLFADQCKQISLPKKCCIAEKITQAAAYMHNSSHVILHRDIMSENIILTDTLETMQLCDLGISKLLKVNSSATTYAQGMKPGTLIFQSPEILLDNASAPKQSDVSGMLGTIVELFRKTPIWDLQYGQEEAEHSSVQTLINLMPKKEVPHVIQKLSQLDSTPKTAVDIVMMGLDYNPYRRPAATDFLTFKFICLCIIFI